MIKYIDLPLKADYIGKDTALMGQIKDILERSEYRGIVIKSPQGTGKSRVIYSLDNKAIITPTRALRGQQAIDYGYEQIIGSKREKWFIYTREKPEISTMTSSIALNLQDLNYLIYDECHKLIDYSTFAADTTAAVLQTLNEATEKGVKIVLVSATPEKLLYYYDLRERREGTPNPIDCIIDIQPQEPKKYINTLYVYMKSKGFYRKLKGVVKKRAEDGKQVALLRKKRNVTDFTIELNTAYECGESDINAVGFTSENTTDNPDFDTLVSSGKFNTRILNSTSLIDCGINLLDEDITDIYNMFTNDLTMHFQLAARARKAQPNYHFQMEELTEQEKKYLQLDDITLFNDLKKTCLDVLKNPTDERQLKYTAGAAKTENGYIYSDLALTNYIIKLRDGAKLSQQESIKAVFVGMYEKYEFKPTDKFLRQTAAERATQKQATKEETAAALETAKVKACSLLDEWSGKAITREERDSIITAINKYGIEGKTLAPLFKRFKLPYMVEEVRRGEIYKIVKI